jgi:hypothetical protein
VPLVGARGEVFGGADPWRHTLQRLLVAHLGSGMTGALQTAAPKHVRS